MPWTSINGIRLYYLVQGHGPAVVFAHGAGGNHLSWWQQVPFFAERYRCVVFDHRAFGRTKDETEGPGRRSFADDLRALLDHLEIERAAIVAQSMGGRTAVGFSYRNPERVSALVLAGTTGGAVSDTVRAAQEEHRQTPMGKRTLYQRAISPRLERERPDLAHLYRLIARLNPPRPKDFLAPIPGYRGSSAQFLGDLGVPILFLVGAEDTIIPPHVVRLAHEAVPGSQYDEIADAGHSAYFEKADVFNERVGRFLQESGWTSE
ncbi:MAG: alpha/beta fold hydrolase [Dehalococcoidia bacterium]